MRGESTGILYTMAMPLRGLEKGTYTLQVHLRDEVAGANLFRRVPLVIEEIGGQSL